VDQIRWFMWTHQDQFQVSAHIAAERIFTSLDQDLKTTVFLVGILVEDRKDRYAICVEPEDCGYDPNLFSDVQEQAQHLEAADPARLTLHSHSIAQETPDRRLILEALRDAIQGVINRQDEALGVISFCSWPVLVQGYMVCTVLQLQRDVFHAYYSLVKNQVNNRYAMATSLIDATVMEYLDGCAEALRNPEPGAELGVLGRDAEEVIRAAGNRLMDAPAWSCGEFVRLPGLFHACNTISSLRYEEAEGIGTMLLSRRGHPNIEVQLALSAPVRMRNYRAARKLLEISSQEISLLSDAVYIYGLGHVVGLYDQRREDLFSINFTKHYTWELLHANHVMMRVTYGQPQLPQMPIDKEQFKQDLRRIFPDIAPKNIEQLWLLVLEATKQKHGTLVVVSSKAQKEAVRLEKQCTRIEPMQLTPEIMRVVTAIDGAVLIDPSATCYAIGVILDGLASERGTSARGARYNSAIRYVEGIGGCLVVVVSEDGSIDLVHD
jgi:DNA integrity scanning protein DisA with diadenylate cyclase activity